MLKTFNNAQSCRGAALITVMLVVALATIAAVAMSAQNQIDLRRTENLLRADQAWQHALGLEDWAVAKLIKDRDNADTKKEDHLVEPWARPMETTEVEGGEVSGQIEDLQGRFNLNSLDKGAWDVADFWKWSSRYFRFIRLLELLEFEKMQAQALAAALVDWIDDDAEQGAGGAEDGSYLALSPSYRTSGRMLTHPSELLLIKGFTPEVYRKLAPYVTALPVLQSRINLNTAPPLLLRAIANPGSMSEEDAKNIAKARLKEHFKSESDFFDHKLLSRIQWPPSLDPKAKPGDKDTTGLTVSSSFFQVQGKVKVGLAQVGIESTLERQGDTVAVIQRLRGSNY